MEARKRTRGSIPRYEIFHDIQPAMKELLPDDVIEEILSWLPVKSVLRFTCVCKSWQIMTQQRSFIEMHKSRSKCQTIYEVDYISNRYHVAFTFMFYGDGLVLEADQRISNMHRIRNPATKQVVEVPEDPLEDPLEVEWQCILMGSNNKVFSVSGTLKNKRPFVIKMLTNDTDVPWRPVGTLLGAFHSYRGFKIGTYKDTSYIISLCLTESKITDIARLNMDEQEESFMSIKVPQGFANPVSGENDLTIEILDWLQLFMWDEKLSLGFIFNKELHVWVLENYMTQKWSEEKIIPFNFMKEYPYLNHASLIVTASEGQLEVYIANFALHFDIYSGKVTCFAEAPPGKELVYLLKPWLVSLKGMHSDQRPIRKRESA